jgi:hypothetical protein
MTTKHRLRKQDSFCGCSVCKRTRFIPSCGEKASSKDYQVYFSETSAIARRVQLIEYSAMQRAPRSDFGRSVIGDDHEKIVIAVWPLSAPRPTSK